ncbi:MAG: hypothetical protein WCO61_04025 [Alphaproteobacteria bacterium]
MRFVVFAAALAACLAPSLSQANEKIFAVPADDGYGMDDCLSEGKACAKLVADSWCQVKGMNHSIRFEAAAPEDITGSLSEDAARPAVAPAYLITCQD